ncbi:uncharacterized protein LOC114714775 [Neltuma alba]|uniref:uncharacterized protein LOC114714775 n=1 Tax=Neltuma alba TaxID=207710 RepID=UPI0010A57D8E|nr:uncharacterized protein LOC114714775 [Prosopis alba]
MSATSSSSSFSSTTESVCEGLEFSESNNILLMALMEETQEDQYYADERLMSMIQSLEAELISTTSSAADPYQIYEIEVGQMDDQDCSTSSLSFSTHDHGDDMEVISANSSSSSPSCSFDEEMMNAWNFCAAGGDDNGDFCYGVLLENCSPQETSDIVF